MKPFSIQIDVPKPCQEDWDDMIASGKGRFCAHCQKQVIDFSTWSDTALYKFFAENDTPVCGRFMTSQLSRPILIPYQPHSRLYRITIGLGLVLIFTQTPGASAGRIPPMTCDQLTGIQITEKDTVGHQQSNPDTTAIKKTGTKSHKDTSLSTIKTSVTDTILMPDLLRPLPAMTQGGALPRPRITWTSPKIKN